MQVSSVSDTDVSPTNEEPVWPDDFDDDTASGSILARARQLLPSMRFIMGMAALGIALALGWRYSGIEEWAFTPSTLAAQAPPAAAAAPTESDLARIVREVEALKKTVTDLASANHQLTVTITALQAGLQELKQRAASVQSNGWHADGAVMKYRMIAQPKAATSSVTQGPAPIPTPRTDARSAPKPTHPAPLQLTAPRP